MKIARSAALLLLIWAVAACDEGDPAGLTPAPPGTNSNPSRPSGDFPIWVQMGNTVGLNARVNREAGFLELPDTVCFLGQFNSWSKDCKVQSSRTAAGQGVEVYLLPVGQVMLDFTSQNGMVGRCGRLTYYWKKFPAQFFPVEEWISARGGLAGLSEQQRRVLAPETGKPVTQTGAGLLPTVTIGSSGAQACSAGP